MARGAGGAVTSLGTRAATLAARTAAICSLLAAGAGAAWAVEPHVPYVPTPSSVVDAMLAIANVGPRDYLVDLGSGDGRIVIAAARRFGTRGFGVDLDENLVIRANEAAQRAGVGDRVQFYARNLFVTDISRATVLTLYLFQSVNVQLRPRLFEALKPGTRVVSHDFDMEGWEPDAQVTVPVPDKPYGAPESQVYLWVIPANAAGAWTGQINTKGAAVAFRADLSQTFQMLSGTAQAGTEVGKVREGRLHGESVRFALEAEMAGRRVLHRFEGRMNGDTIVGTVKWAGGPMQDWSARRTRPAAINLSTTRAEM